MGKTVLRPYQARAALDIRLHARRGYGAILQMPTGAGKTAVFCEFLMTAHAKGKYAIMAVRGKALVHQASARLKREGVPHGVYQGANTANVHEKILICSIDTLYSRKIAPAADLIVLDECHLTHSEGYTWFLSQYPKTFKLGVSATPHHKKGMRHIGDALIYPASFMDLVKDGFLVGGRYFVPYIPDLRGVTKSGGDFASKELGERAIKDTELTANAAKVWSDNLRGKSTLAYAVSVEHARVLDEALRRAGARAAVITAATPDEEREALIAKLESGRLDILTSVGVLTTGVDIPSLSAILCCRPTESYNLWIQILGRGTRPHPTKRQFLCYDLSGNLLRHGPIEAELVGDLDGFPAVPKTPLILCPACYAIHARADIPDDKKCPACGEALPASSKRTAGRKRLHGLTENSEVVEKVVEPWELKLPILLARAKEKGLRKGWLYHAIKGEFGESVANSAWPRIRALKKWPVRQQPARREIAG